MSAQVVEGRSEYVQRVRPCVRLKRKVGHSAARHIPIEVSMVDWRELSECEYIHQSLYSQQAGNSSGCL